MICLKKEEDIEGERMTIYFKGLTIYFKKPTYNGNF